MEDIRRGLCGLEEGRFADLALNVASLLVLYHMLADSPAKGTIILSTYHLELRLGRGLVLSSALALLLSLGTLKQSCQHRDLW